MTTRTPSLIHLLLLTGALPLVAAGVGADAGYFKVDYRPSEHSLPQHPDHGVAARRNDGGTDRSGREEVDPPPPMNGTTLFGPV